MPLPAVTFNKDTVKLGTDVRDNITHIDFHVPGSNSVAPRATPILDGRSTECLVTYRSDDRTPDMPPETFKVAEDKEFPDYVEVSIHGPQEDPITKKHYIWGTASDGTKNFEAKWIQQ